MDTEHLNDLLGRFKRDEISKEMVIEELVNLPYKDIKYAKLDFHRDIRTGFSEVIYCENKSYEHIIKIVDELIKHQKEVLLTRVKKEIYDKIKSELNGKINNINYNEAARVLSINKKEKGSNKKGYILIATAGTADFNVSEEAREVLEFFDTPYKLLYDIGVSGIHRVFENLDLIRNADVVIAVAGMEGALASVLGGIVNKTLIAVPTSVGYGSNFEGLSALLSMLNSCANGVLTVNIDNGFGAAYCASVIYRQIRGGNE